MENRKKQKKIGSVVAREMKIVGEVTFRGQLLIQGKVEGSLTGDQVELGRSGILDGEVRIKELDCSGKARGVLSAEQIKVRKTAEVTGVIQAGELEMVSGAVFAGEMNITPGSSSRNSGAATGPPAKKDNPDKPVPPVADREQGAEFKPESTILEGLAGALAGGSSLGIVISDNKDVRRSICLQLQDKLKDSFQQLFVEEPTGSFREMLVNVAAGFNVELADYSNQDVIIENLTVFMKESGEYLLVVDNAERMYPATLEKMVRYLVGKDDQTTALTKLVLFGGSELKKMLDYDDSKFFMRDPDCIFEL